MPGAKVACAARDRLGRGQPQLREFGTPVIRSGHIKVLAGSRWGRGTSHKLRDRF